MLDYAQNRVSWFLSVFFFGLVALVVINPSKPEVSPFVQPQPPLLQPEVLPKPLDPELNGVQVPVPWEMRVFNKTEVQCVWCAAEMLGKYHNVKGIRGLTQEQLGFSDPRRLAQVLRARNVKFKQVNGRDLDFLQEWVAQKKMGAGIGVFHTHVILICHFERGKQVKIIDSSDMRLKIQTWDWRQFQQAFTGWAFTILPDAADDEYGFFVDEYNLLVADDRWRHFPPL